jgi:sugar phosphate isomerase/epimerase
MSIRRGVSLYSYQQTQFFGIKNLWQQIREVREGLGTDGIEIISQQAIPGYPFPSDQFTGKWHEVMARYGMTAVAYDAHLDVLQFRDHVMDLDEAADRLKRDIRIAHRLGFGIVRTHSSHGWDVHMRALPLAEELGIRLAKEIHAPMSLTGPDVTEIIEYCEKTGTASLGLVPDFGIFQTRINQPTADWYVRNGCKRETVDFAQSLCDNRVVDQLDPAARSFESHQHFVAYVLQGTAPPNHLAKGISEYVALCKASVPDPTPLDWDLLGWPLRMPQSTGEELQAVAGYVFSCHGKFYDMTEIPGRPGEYEDKAVDYETAVAALKRGGFTGYINSENEGQRHYHDLDREFYQDEVEQARRHHEMLARLINAPA